MSSGVKPAASRCSFPSSTSSRLAPVAARSRGSTMIAFGGGGPLHASSIAREIFIPTVVVPKLPGTFSALGMLMASWRQDFVQTLIGRLGSLKKTQVESVFDELTKAGSEQIARDD